MGNEKSAGKPRTWVRKLGKILLVGSVSVVVLVFAARLVWRFYGSNQWEFVEESDGVRVYTLKAPGSDLLKFKGVSRVRAPLSNLVKMFQDPEICLEAGCTATRMVERVDDQQQFYAFQHTLEFPFRKREFVVREQFYQNPHTKAILMEVMADPDKIPPDDCCFRVTDMNNTWLFTPLDNGEVEIEWVLNMNEGGFLPDLMLNTMRSGVFFYILPRLQEWVMREKYQNAKFDFITEKTPQKSTELIPGTTRTATTP
jgi:hypothetical protein